MKEAKKNQEHHNDECYQNYERSFGKEDVNGTEIYTYRFEGFGIILLPSRQSLCIPCSS